VPKDAPRAIQLPDEVWVRPEVLDLCRSQDADGLIRLAKKYGHTNEAIGYWTGIDSAEISKRLAGTKGPVRTLDRWHRIADGFNMPDGARHALGISSRQPEAPVPAEPTRTSVPMPATPPKPLTVDPSAVDPQFPRTLLDLLTQYARTDNMLGPRPLLLAVASQLALIEQFWNIARGPVRSELLAVGARYAEFAGWLHQDAGDHATAARWTLQALELAHSAESPVLAAYVLMRRSNQASTIGDGARTLGLAAAALDTPQAGHPMLAALSLRQRARGYALDGNARECERALDDARHQLTEMSTDVDPLIRSLAGYCTPSYIEMEAADCWVQLGRPERAVSIYESELANWPEVYRRDRGVHLARLASAYAACNDLERAHHTALEAVAMAEQTGSSRVVDELTKSLGRLDRPGPQEGAAPLRERLAALTAAAGDP
jgi:tetratricopeptide (TPR) repeat protein